MLRISITTYSAGGCKKNLNSKKNDAKDKKQPKATINVIIDRKILVL